jgi:DNA-binding GntR family transcriptional regulator
MPASKPVPTRQSAARQIAPAQPATKRSPAEAVEAVVAHLKQLIKLGSVGPGHRLVEAEIVKATGASRGRVREALKLLAAEGFVQIEEFKGASIRKLSRQEVVEMYQLRALLEGFSIRQAAEIGLSAAQKTELSRLQQAMDKAEADGRNDAFRQLNDDYHLFMRRASGNSLLHEHLERLRLPLLLAQFHRYFDTRQLVDANADHRVMTAALLASDATRAEKVMRRHVSDGLRSILALDERFFA